MQDYNVDDFEVVKEIEPVHGCDLCWFYKECGHNKRCSAVTNPVGIELEKLTGGCETGFHYTLKNNTDGTAN